MANMSYCMFENTSEDLGDCLETLRDYDSIQEYIDDNHVSEDEIIGISRLLQYCKTISDIYYPEESEESEE